MIAANETYKKSSWGIIGFIFNLHAGFVVSKVLMKNP